MADANTEEGKCINSEQHQARRDEPDDWPKPSRERGCMMCQQAQRVTNFSQLQPGDQISMPGRPPVPLLGLLYRHQAIVIDIKRITNDGKTAELTVIDVDEKGKLKPYLPFNRAPYKIKSHVLYDYDVHKLSTCMVCLSKDAVYLEKVSYRKRKFSKEATMQRAKKCHRATEDADVTYCFCCQNCEHFVETCVNGPNIVDEKSYDKTVSRQALDFLWFSLSVVFWLLQACYYGFDLMVYALYDKTPPDEDFMNLSISQGVRDVVREICVSNETRYREFRTRCDWYFLFIFFFIFLVLFMFILLGKYLPLYTKGYICKLCFVTTALTLVSRIALFMLIEIINNFTKYPFYDALTEPTTSRGTTIFLLLFVSASGALLVYTLSSLVAKIVMWIGGFYYSHITGYCEYVPYRGLIWLFCCLGTCCCKDGCCCCKNKMEDDGS